ncbi:MAG: hypothetical protein KatS3mg105_0998 [Gemmatales bacterium]|nr:MAG: hypothetical protein KatS3mg105_0998 [Gemmatales bacterium]
MNQRTMERHTPASVAFKPVPHQLPARERRLREELCLVDRLVHDLRDAFRSLSRRVRSLGPFQSATRLLLAGVRDAVGCSTTALAFAKALAGDIRVLLVDGNFRRPGLSMLLHHSTFGWEDALRGRCSLAHPLQFADPERLVSFLPLSAPITKPDEVFHGPALQAWFSQLCQDYDLLIIDGGPVQQTGYRWATCADCAILICDQKHHDRAKAWDTLEENGIHVLGVIETFAITPPANQPRRDMPSR